MSQKVEILLVYQMEQMRCLKMKRRDAENKEARLELTVKEEQNILRCIGKCPMNFAWISQGSGYPCAGESHNMSGAQLNYL